MSYKSHAFLQHDHTGRLRGSLLHLDFGCLNFDEVCNRVRNQAPLRAACIPPDRDYPVARKVQHLHLWFVPSLQVRRFRGVLTRAPQIMHGFARRFSDAPASTKALHSEMTPMFGS